MQRRFRDLHGKDDKAALPLLNTAEDVNFGGEG